MQKVLLFFVIVPLSPLDTGKASKFIMGFFWVSFWSRGFLGSLQAQGIFLGFNMNFVPVHTSQSLKI